MLNIVIYIVYLFIYILQCHEYIHGFRLNIVIYIYYIFIFILKSYEYIYGFRLNIEIYISYYAYVHNERWLI